MRIVEIRDLDGPNLFLMAPAIKIELGDVSDHQQVDIIDRLIDTVRDLHTAVGIDPPETAYRRMQTPGHISVAFGWNRRSFAERLGSFAAEAVLGESPDREHMVQDLRRLLADEPDEDDAPQVVHPSGDRAPIISVTGTNGKTTTSRLLDFVLRHAGYRVGLTSSAGVYIDNKQVQEGDYSGPSGARRVLNDPSVEYAVLETARGGLLLRGCGYAAADVAVVTNVTSDHLGLHGINTIEGLAAVKAIVARNVKPGGFCILNANNTYTLAMRDVTPGRPVLFSRNIDSDVMREHIAQGGAAISKDEEKNVHWYQDGESRFVTTLDEIPMTFGGKAPHQVENALAAIAALIGVGLPISQIHDGIAAFRSTAANSRGRLNLFEVNGGTVIVDFAHNEAGLSSLLDFARNYVGEGGRLIAVVGTAGDRDDESLRAIARTGVEKADLVVLKDSVRYLRGRESGDMLAIMRNAIRGADTEVREAPTERDATFAMVDELQPGDVIAVMCVEDYDYILHELGKIGEVVA